MNPIDWIKHRTFILKLKWKFGWTGYDKQREPDSMDIERVVEKHFKKEVGNMESKKGG